MIDRSVTLRFVIIFEWCEPLHVYPDSVVNHHYSTCSGLQYSKMMTWRHISTHLNRCSYITWHGVTSHFDQSKHLNIFNHTRSWRTRSWRAYKYEWLRTHFTEHVKKKYNNFQLYVYWYCFYYDLSSHYIRIYLYAYILCLRGVTTHII